MFLTRSKTSSALNSEQHGKSKGNNMFPLIPKEMISDLEDAVPAIELALQPVLSESAKELLVNMISTWITTSRISTNNFNAPVVNKPKPVNLRTWASRSFSIRSKSFIAPQKTEISDTKLGHDRTPSFTDSESSTSSFSITSVKNRDNDNSPLLNSLGAKKHVSRLPVSLKSMIDLLDTPPLIPSDEKSLSLIEESLTPLSSTFFHDNNHLQPHNTDSPASCIAVSFNTVSEENGESEMTSTSKDSKFVRRSFSTIFTQLGHSVKKVFKKKPEISSGTKLKKTMSVQHNLQRQASPTSLSTRRKLYSSLSPSKESPEKVVMTEKPGAKAYSEAFTTFLSTRKISKPVAAYDKTLYQIPQSSTSSIASDFDQMDNLIQPKAKSNKKNYWDGEATQSQQFDQLLDDIWERSQEYQDYFAAEEKLEHSNNSFNTNFNNHFKNNALWSPSGINKDQDKFSSTVRPSKTEGNMNKFDEGIPFVCVGKKNDLKEKAPVSILDKRRSHQVKRNLNIEDVKAYKRSTSAYSNIRDYDLNWQKSFHVEQKSREKVAKTLKSVSWAFYNMIKRNHNLVDFSCDAIFNEAECGLSDDSIYSHCTEPLTDWNDIYDQLAYVFDCGELTAEHAIITFIYAKRMLDLSKQKLWDFSWRMIVMSSLLTAVKVWDDCAIFNADFAMIFPELTLDVINTIERVFLTYLGWDVSVNCSDFARTYFHLRDIEHMMDQW
ncbi:hypothetical protein HPULCUR_011102 [Helicostylum pulchrum]|uniref:Cyclin N-terminal domain-containing protein n=1 Tax=Helicostylum pulchrum TaxID=562976 RepID=A0ABP9YG80_9FUNG